MINHPLFADDSADRAQFLKLFVKMTLPGLALLVMGEGVGLGKGWYGGGAFLLLLLLDLPLLFLLSTMLWFAIEGTASGFARTVLGMGNLKPEPAHSGCESLVARGFYRESVTAFEALIAEYPEDNLARIKLSEVYRDHLGDPHAAERLLLDVRRHHPDPGHEILASNLLIELYRATGRRDRLLVELARFADRYKGTRAGSEAARALKELKQESEG